MHQMHPRPAAAHTNRDVDLDEVRRQFRFAREQMASQSSTEQLRAVAMRHWRESRRRVEPSSDR
jgi:hypothetical protein